MVDHCIARYPAPPPALVLDLDHSDEPTHGQPEFPFYTHYYQNYCSLPLCIVEGTSHALVTAVLRPGIRPTGTENALIFVRLLASLRRSWPPTPILVRGESHCAPPEILDVLAPRRRIDCVFGLAGKAVLLRQAAPTLQEARRLHRPRSALAPAHGPAPPLRRRLYDAFVSAAQSWAQPWRVVLKADGMGVGDNPRFVVTSLDAPRPHMLSEDLYCARSNGANAIQAVQVDLHSDRTSATTFLAHAMRLVLACAA